MLSLSFSELISNSLYLRLYKLFLANIIAVDINIIVTRLAITIIIIIIRDPLSFSELIISLGIFVILISSFTVEFSLLLDAELFKEITTYLSIIKSTVSVANNLLVVNNDNIH